MKPKFVQLVSGTSLVALDERGDCWVYMGRKFGWAPMNMDVLTEREARLAWKGKCAEEDDYDVDPGF